MADPMAKPFNMSCFDKLAFMFIQCSHLLDKKVNYLLDSSFNEGAHVGLAASCRGSDGWIGWSVVDGNHNSPVASCGLERRCEI